METLKYQLVVFIMIGSGLSQAQTEHTYERGIYLSFEEFLNNSPKIKDEFQVLEETEMTISRAKNTLGKIVKGNQKMISIYRIKDKGGKNIKGFRKYWGFSDGISVYINSTTHTKADHFVKLDLIGPICYFFQLGNESGLQKLQPYDPGDIRQSYPTSTPKLYYLDQYILNMKSGRIDKLTKVVLSQMVSPYTDLVGITNGLDKQDIFIDVIRLYNFRLMETLKD